MKNLSITVTEQEFESRLASQQSLCVSACPEWCLTTKVNELKWKLLACILLEFSGRITQSLEEKIEKLEISIGYCGIEAFWKSLRKYSACTSLIGLWEPEAPSLHAEMGNKGSGRKCGQPCLGLAVKPASLCQIWGSDAFPDGTACFSWKPRQEDRNILVAYPLAQHNDKDQT